MVRIAPLLALVAVVSLAAGAFHHPEPDHSHPLCAVCLLGAMPAVGAAAIAAPVAPGVPVERCLPPAAAPLQSHAASPSRSRAPPQA